VDSHTCKGHNVLVTGGSGLVGSSIDFGLKPSSKTLNLLDRESIIRYFDEHPSVDSVIHAAGLVGGVKGNSDRLFDFFNQNLMMAVNLMDAIASNPRVNNVTFLLSTCIFPQNVSYPVSIEMLHQGEPHPTNYGYAYAKRMLEVGARALRQQYGKNIRCLVPCNLYGPNDNYNMDTGHVIPSLIHKCYLAKRDNTPFRVWGSGNAEREFMYACDIGKVMGAIHLDSVDTGEIMIVSTGEQHTIRSVVDLICKHMDFSGEVVYDTSKPEGIMKKPTINGEFVEFIAKTGISLTSLNTGLELSIQDFTRRYPNVRM
jgi:GDP-L-fucose synthase